MESFILQLLLIAIVKSMLTDKHIKLLFGKQMVLRKGQKSSMILLQGKAALSQVTFG